MDDVMNVLGQVWDWVLGIWVIVKGFALEIWDFGKRAYAYALDFRDKELRDIDFLIFEMSGLLAATALLTFLACWIFFGGSAAARRRRMRRAHAKELDMTRSLLTQSRAATQRAERKQEDLRDRLAQMQEKLAAAPKPRKPRKPRMSQKSKAAMAK